MKEMTIKKKLFGEMREVEIQEKETGEVERILCTEDFALKIAGKEGMVVTYSKEIVETGDLG